MGWRSGTSQKLKLLGELRHLCHQGLNCSGCVVEIPFLVVHTLNAGVDECF